MAQDYTNLQKMAQQYQQQSPNQPNPKTPKSGLGCVLVIVLAAFFVGMGLLVYFWVYPTYFSNSGSDDNDDKISADKKSGSDRKVSKKTSLKGIFMNAVILPGENEKNNLWVMTYRNKGTRYFVNTYIYDPIARETIKSFETEYPTYPPQTKLFYINDEVWRINTETTGIEADINVYDPVSGDEKMNKKSFSDKFPELQGGISKINAYGELPKIDLETKDGKKPVYDLLKDKMYENYSAYRNSFKDDKTTMTIFALGLEKSSESARKKLFLLTGPKTSLWEKNISESYFDNPSTLKFFTKSEAKSISGDKIFLEGEMLYQDDECCFIFHQTQVGSDADRLLSCIEKDGNILWTASTENDLFSKLRATSKDPISGMFFIKHNVHVLRSGDMVLFTFDRFGFIGFDYKTGKKIFEAELSK
ncbi:MAG: hypothetical protein NTU73_00215 [Ignavibacteriae bacterium]|nr:hypothetical protein [Ignavibacteriota bacterium]